jgi:hypothetical protein
MIRVTFEYTDSHGRTGTYLRHDIVAALTEAASGRELYPGNVVIRSDSDRSEPGKRLYVADVRRGGWVRLVDQTWDASECDWIDVAGTARSVRTKDISLCRRPVDWAPDFLRPRWEPTVDTLARMGGTVWTTIDHSEGTGAQVYVSDTDRAGILEWHGGNVHRIAAFGSEDISRVENLLTGRFSAANCGATVLNGDHVSDAVERDHRWRAERCPDFTTTRWSQPGVCSMCRAPEAMHVPASPWVAV